MCCRVCLDASVCNELTVENDLSYYSIGNAPEEKHRMMIRSGAGKPLAILVEEYDDVFGWLTIAQYTPKFCPECGRELVEYGKR